jgi:hypothetical protein
MSSSPIAYSVEGVSQFSRLGFPATCFFFCLMLTTFGAVNVTLFAKLPLLVIFSHDYGLVIADIEHHVTMPW